MQESCRDASFICPKEAARKLGVSEGTVRRWLRDGVIKGTKVGGTWLVPAGFATDPGSFIAKE